METCHGDCQRYNDWKGVIAMEAVARKKENDSHSTPKLNKDFTRMRLGIKQWDGKVR